MSCSTVQFVLMFTLCAILFGASILPAAERTPLQQAEELLRDRAYAAAAARLQPLAAAPSAHQDEACFLLGNALLLQGHAEAARTWYEKIYTEFPQSPWTPKAKFKAAECATKLKQFDHAAAIYADEITRLVAPARKAEIAQVYLQFAADYFSGAWVKRQNPAGQATRPDYDRAKTFYQLALQMEIGAANAAELRLQIARCDLELGNYLDAITTLTALLQAEITDATRIPALSYLGQAYLRQGDMLQARKTLHDFIDRYPDDALAADAAFFVSRTYGLPTPASLEALELGVHSLQEFLERYPDHHRAAQAEYEIGLAEYHFGRADDAAAAFRSYIERHADDLAPDAANAALVTQSTPPDLITASDGLALARYYLGKIYQQQRKFQDALSVWQTYLQQHSAHQLWSEVQREMLDTEFLIAADLFERTEYAPARAAWEQFLTTHPLDQRNPDIMYQIGATFVKQAQYDDALAQWTRAVSKYPATEAASQAQFAIGNLLETKLLKFPAAFAAYQKVTWGSFAAQAQERLQQMQAKQLAVITERVFRAAETPTLKVTTRNIAKLTFKMYKVDLETYFRKMHTTDGLDQLDIALIDPDQTWPETISNYEPYRAVEQQFPMQFTAPGAYLVTCAEETEAGSGGYEATTFVLVSDLDIIFKTTKQDTLILAQNMRTGAAYPGVKLLLSDGQKIFAESVTQADGVFHQAFPELKDRADLRVFAYDGQHYAATTLALGDLRYVAGLTARGYIYTDRPAYRPGQTVHVKGILRAVDAQGNFRVPAASETQRYDVQILNA